MLRGVTKKQINFVRSNADKGISFCCSGLKCSRTTIWRIAYNHNIEIRDDSNELDIGRAFRGQRRIDSDQFINIAKPEIAYFLGYLWADGYVSINARKVFVLIFNIASEDAKEISTIMDSPGEWRIYKGVNKQGTEITNYQTSNPTLIKWLIVHGYDRKSYVSPSKILSVIPKHLQHYWWRGYLDGDGHFRIGGGLYHFSFTGDYVSDWSGHTSLLDELGIRYKVSHRLQKEGRKSDVVCSNIEGTYAFGSYIYRGYDKDGIGLLRKYNKWLECKERYEDQKKTDAIVIDIDPETILDKELLIKILKKYEGMISLRQIAKHFGLKWWQVSEMTKYLRDKGRIEIMGRCSLTRYKVIE